MAKMMTSIYKCPQCNGPYFEEKILTTYVNDGGEVGELYSKEFCIVCSNCKYVVKRSKVDE